jgi:hypothetical protein
MNELIERYIHQVGLYVRPKERAEIEAELRSQIQDQLEDRYGSAPTQADVIAVLKQLGDPRMMATSYSGDAYLVGPMLYPFMMTVLRFGLPLVPAVVVVANVLGAALSPDGADWLGLVLGSAFTAVQAVLIFFAVVVLFFWILQHSGTERKESAQDGFDPLTLPAINAPDSVDRFEAAFGIAIGTLISLALLYFWQVGGLTLRFNLNDAGYVLPVSTNWLAVLFFTTLCSIFLNLWALIRNRWTWGTWLLETAFNFVGAIGLYFVLFTPIVARIIESSPQLSFLERLPFILTLLIVILMVLGNGSKLIRLWQQRQGART